MLGESYLGQGLMALGRLASRPIACAIALRGDRLPHLRRRLPMYGRGCAENCSVFHWPFFVVPHYYLFGFVRYERDGAVDDEAFCALVERWQGWLLGFLTRSLGSRVEVEDLA